MSGYDAAPPPALMALCAWRERLGLGELHAGAETSVPTTDGQASGRDAARQWWRA